MTTATGKTLFDLARVSQYNPVCDPLNGNIVYSEWHTELLNARSLPQVGVTYTIADQTKKIERWYKSHPKMDPTWTWEESLGRFEELEKANNQSIMQKYFDHMIEYAYNDFQQRDAEALLSKCSKIMKLGQPRHHLTMAQLEKIHGLVRELNKFLGDSKRAYLLNG